ncbi:hypothetical protein GQ457_16G014580 [Hibiscus cannabinus]
MLFALAVILDPRYKLSFLKYYYENIFEDEIEASLKISDPHFKLGMLFKEYAPETRVPYETSLNLSSNSNTISTSSSDHKRKFNLFTVITEDEEFVSSFVDLNENKSNH